MPTAIWKSPLRSGSAHWDLELAVEVRQCPLGSGARGGGPAVPTGIWTARRRRRVRRRRRRRWRRRRRRRRRRTALIKSNNPHLAGGEKCSEMQVLSSCHFEQCSNSSGSLLAPVLLFIRIYIYIYTRINIIVF